LWLRLASIGGSPPFWRPTLLATRQLKAHRSELIDPKITEHRRYEERKRDEARAYKAS
jgi:hypothetical protein